MFTLPLALGSLGVENCLRHRSLLGALVLRACHVTARCWEPWCEELFALPIALSCGVSGPYWGSFWRPLGALLDCLWALLGPSWGPLGPSWGLLEAFGSLGALLAASWGPLGSLLGLSWGSLGAVLGPSRAVSGPSWAVLEPSWAFFGSFCEPLGPSWDDLWSLLGSFRQCLGRKC